MRVSPAESFLLRVYIKGWGLERGGILFRLLESDEVSSPMSIKGASGAGTDG